MKIELPDQMLSAKGSLSGVKLGFDRFEGNWEFNHIISASPFSRKFAALNPEIPHRGSRH